MSIGMYIEKNELPRVIDSLPTCTVDKRVLKLLFTKQYKQRSDEWLEKRRSILTASDAASALEMNKYQSRKDLILKKSGIYQSKSSGDPSANIAMQHGIDHEDEAADIYMHRNPHLAPFFEIGLVMHPDHPFLGASPDRVTKDGILIEIKVPFTRPFSPAV